MSRVFDSKGNNVTAAWAYVRPNPAITTEAFTMSRLIEVLDQWHEAQRIAQHSDRVDFNSHFDEREEKHAHVGEKYVRLDVGTSGAWMLELFTGDIFGILAYGKVNRKKCAGNINDPDFTGAVLFRDRFRHGRFDNRKVGA